MSGTSALHSFHVLWTSPVLAVSGLRGYQSPALAVHHDHFSSSHKIPRFCETPPFDQSQSRWLDLLTPVTICITSNMLALTSTVRVGAGRVEPGSGRSQNYVVATGAWWKAKRKQEQVHFRLSGSREAHAQTDLKLSVHELDLKPSWCNPYGNLLTPLRPITHIPDSSDLRDRMIQFKFTTSLRNRENALAELKLSIRRGRQYVNTFRSSFWHPASARSLSSSWASTKSNAMPRFPL